MSNINFEKYANMDKKQLVNSLVKAEKEEEKIKKEMSQKLNDTKELIKFLKSKIKESLSPQKYYTLETSPAMKEIDKWAKENPELAAQADRELEEEMRGYYENHNSTQGYLPLPCF